MSAGRPVGNHIRAICAMMDDGEPLSAKKIFEKYQMLEEYQICKYLNRAVDLGLMTVVRGNRQRSNPNQYRVVSGWRDLIEMRKTTRIKAAPKPIKPLKTPSPSNWSGVNSVFNMGAA